MNNELPAYPVVTHEEKMKTVLFWRQHAEHLRANKLVSENGLSWISMCTDSPEKIGYDGMEGQIRPGDLGKWDLYGILQMSCMFKEAELLLLADISPTMKAAEDRREEILYSGFNPDDPASVREFDRMKAMTPEEADAEIERLEGVLAKRGE